MKEKKKLGELASTAICGNDITSSVLYVSALSIGYAGQYAWITLLTVSGVLYLFRKIYGEVVGALPLNGGAYNALLNTTSKSTASLAATLTLLSYMATSVISANEAMHYLHDLIEELPINLATIILLGIFSLLTINGLKESAAVAIGIFLFHLVSLTLLATFIIIYLATHGIGLFYQNWNLPLGGDLSTALFLGFAASMLGISGFESSANFVEEQKPGVFPKTLRNMWLVVSIINPLMAFLALSVVPIADIKNQFSTTLLSHMGSVSAGSWLASIVSLDAVLVLSGAVLTSYIGVTGLLERMALDRILPQYFLKKNSNNSSYRIIITFFLLSVSVLLITEGETGTLAGVYTISFLSVMLLFGFGNILLKVKRKRLPRPETARWLSVITAIIAVLVALYGNIQMQPARPDLPANTEVFLEYFIPAMLFISFMLNRVSIMRMFLQILRYVFKYIRDYFFIITKSINRTIDEINSQTFVYFTKQDNLAMLNQVILYIQKNEHTRNLMLVHVTVNHDEQENKFIREFKKIVKFINEEYPEIEVKGVIEEGEFGPELIRRLSDEWNIPVNFMFITSPGDHFPFRVEELGGVRLII